MRFRTGWWTRRTRPKMTSDPMTPRTPTSLRPSLHRVRHGLRIRRRRTKRTSFEFGRQARTRKDGLPFQLFRSFFVITTPRLIVDPRPSRPHASSAPSCNATSSSSSSSTTPLPHHGPDPPALLPQPPLGPDATPASPRPPSHLPLAAHPYARRHPAPLLAPDLPAGARVVAGYRGEDEKVAAEDAREARDHCHHAVHDLEANGFFVSLAAAGRTEPQIRLLDWDSEERLRPDYRKSEQRGQWPAPAPDGGGCLLTPTGRVEFELEWDRGTESLGRLRGKARGYVQRYSRIRDADCCHVLFVLSTYDREMDTHTQIWREHPRFASDQCCAFWTTTRRRLEEHGPLGPIWLQVDNRSEKRPGAPHLPFARGFWT
jgi:Replication-relaxation